MSLCLVWLRADINHLTDIEDWNCFMNVCINSIHSIELHVCELHLLLGIHQISELPVLLLLLKDFLASLISPSPHVWTDWQSLRAGFWSVIWLRSPVCFATYKLTQHKEAVFANTSNTSQQPFLIPRHWLIKGFGQFVQWIPCCNEFSARHSKGFSFLL